MEPRIRRCLIVFVQRGWCSAQRVVAARALLAWLLAGGVRALKMASLRSSLEIWLGAAAVVGALVALGGINAAAAEQPLTFCQSGGMSGLTSALMDVREGTGSLDAVTVPQATSVSEQSGKLAALPLALQSNRLALSWRADGSLSATRTAGTEAAADRGPAWIEMVAAGNANLSIRPFGDHTALAAPRWLSQTAALGKSRRLPYAVETQRPNAVVLPVRLGRVDLESSRSIFEPHRGPGIWPSLSPELVVGTHPIDSLALRIVSRLIGTSLAGIRDRIPNLVVIALLQALGRSLVLGVDAFFVPSPPRALTPRDNLLATIFESPPLQSSSGGWPSGAGLRRSEAMVGCRCSASTMSKLRCSSRVLDLWLPPLAEIRRAPADGSSASDLTPGSSAWIVLFLSLPVGMSRPWRWPSRPEHLRPLAWVSPMKRPG